MPILKRNKIVHLRDVFTTFFIDYMEGIIDPDNLQEKDLQMTMAQIENYEEKNHCQFVCFMGNEFLIFRNNENSIRRNGF